MIKTMKSEERLKHFERTIEVEVEEEARTDM